MTLSIRSTDNDGIRVIDSGDIRVTSQQVAYKDLVRFKVSINKANKIVAHVSTKSGIISNIHQSKTFDKEL